MRQTVRIILFCMITAGLLAGCGTGFLKSTKGRVVKADQRIPLPDGKFGSLWDTRDLVVSYDGTRTGSHLEISGSVELTGGLENFSVVRGFYLQAWFLDAEGRVLSEKRLFTGGHMASVRVWTFRREIELPEDTAAMSFGYSGEARDSAVGRESASFSFWMMPFE